MAVANASYFFGLHHRSWKAVQQKASAAFWLIQVAVDHVNDQIVGHQLASIHDTLQLGTDFRSPGNLLAQHVAGRQMAHAELLLQQRSLSSKRESAQRLRDTQHSA